MLQSLEVTKATHTRRLGLGIDRRVIGETFSNHMFTMVYDDGAWLNPEVVPCGRLPVPPGVAEASE